MGNMVFVYDFFRLEVQKTETEAFANVGLAFCDHKDTSKCVVELYLLKDAILPLPICHPNGTVTWPKGLFSHVIMFVYIS